MNPDEIKSQEKPKEKSKIIFSAPPMRPGGVVTSSPAQSVEAEHANKEKTSDIRSYAYDAGSITKDRHLAPDQRTVAANRNFVEDSGTSAPLDAETRFKISKGLDLRNLSEPAIPSTTDPNPSSNIRSFAYDIKSEVTDNNISVAQMVLAENRQREESGTTAEDLQAKAASSGIMRSLLISIGAIAILGGAGMLVYTFIRTQPVPILSDTRAPEVLRVDKTSPILLPDASKRTMVQKIAEARGASAPIDTIVDLEPTLNIDGNKQILTSAEFIAIFDSNVPEELSRTIQDEFSFGIYAHDTNSIYMVLRADNYSNAYAGMLAWEKDMRNEIGQVFYDNSSLPLSTSGTIVNEFIDKIYWNQDTRAILGKDKEPVFLWSIVNRDTIVIASNDEILREILDRLTLSNIVR